ncbi:MAG: hypothetical protein ACTSWY_00110 [Promethearchaeota archaeon]
MIDKNNAKQDTKVLTLRISAELKDRITRVKEKMNSKLSRVSENYLNLSKIMIVRSDSTKIGWDNIGLCIFPESIVQKLFNILKTEEINDEINKFKIWANLGDEFGKYLNDIFSLRDIKEDDYEEMFDFIKLLGWFSYQKMKYREDMIIVIPKSFGNKTMIYSMIYRILTKSRYPDDWDFDLLDADEKQEKEKKYKSIKEILDPDIKKQKSMSFYYFKKLRIKSKEIEK